MVRCLSPTPPTAPAHQPGAPTPPPQTVPAMWRGQQGHTYLSCHPPPSCYPHSLSTRVAAEGPRPGQLLFPLLTTRLPPRPVSQPPILSRLPRHTMPSRPWRLSLPWAPWWEGALHGQSNQLSRDCDKSWPLGSGLPGEGKRQTLGFGGSRHGLWLLGPPRAMSSGF